MGGESVTTLLPWPPTTIRIHCDNQAVISVLTTGKTKDHILADIARNILMETAEKDICLRKVHIRGKDNHIDDTLLRWFIADGFKSRLFHLLPNHVWDQILPNALDINWEV